MSAFQLRFGKRRSPDRCPPGWMLTRHVAGEPPEPWFERHLRQCARCSAECASLASLVTQVQRLDPPAEMTSAARHAISARLLTTGSEKRVRAAWQRRFLGVGAAAAAVLIVAAVLGVGRREHASPRESVALAPPSAAPRHAAAPAAVPPDVEPGTPGGSSVLRSRATIRAIGAARFTRVQAPPDDVVRLDQGAIVLEVAPLAAGERFRVRTEDGEVEVRGTRFQVAADDGKLIAVSVSSGRVEVRSPGGGHVVLEPGDEWVRGPDEPRVGSRASSSRAVRPKDGSPPATVPASFDRAWSLLRQGDARQAAALFAEVERTAGDRDIAEDALYWCAVATTKAGDRAQAQALFERFLRRFPTSARAGEAAAALGWLYVESGRTGDAHRAFERAADDPSPAVRASARDGLQRTPGR